MKCEKCGEETHDGSKFCSGCGNALEAVPEAAILEPNEETEPVAQTDDLAEVQTDTPASSTEDAVEPVEAQAQVIEPDAVQTVAEPPNPANAPPAQPVYQPAQVATSVIAPPPPAMPPALLCGRCGKPFAPNEAFCSVCGTSATFAKPAVQKQSNTKALVLVLSIVFGVIIIALGIVLAIFLSTDSKYKKAVDYMNAGDYEQAYVLFDELGVYKDSEELKDYCSDAIDYNEAEILFARGDYAGAKKIYDRLYDFEDSFYKAKQCQKHLDYEEAKYYFDQEMWWEAYTLFKASDIDDSAEWAEKCIQTPPSNGIIVEGPAYSKGSCAIVIINDGHFDMYIKAYTADDDFYCTFYIKVGTRTTIYVPSGSYCFNMAYGENWFGADSMFGDEGYYDMVMFISDGKIETLVDAKSNIIWTLTLGTDSVLKPNGKRHTF